jgi:MoxR-like ATPase
MGTTISEHDFPRLTRDTADIIASVFDLDRRVLLFGAPGVGKSTLVTELAQATKIAQHRHENRQS